MWVQLLYFDPVVVVAVECNWCATATRMPHIHARRVGVPLSVSRRSLLGGRSTHTRIYIYIPLVYT